MEKIDFLLENNKKYLWLIPCLLAFICFINTVGFGFVYDDIYVVVKAIPVLQNWNLENLKILFTTDIWTFLTQTLEQSEKKDSIYYRPIFGLFLMFNYLFAGNLPAKWHLVSVLLHVLATGLSYQTIVNSLDQITTNKPVVYPLALISSIIFAVHPAQSESIAWISAYVNSLVAILVLLSLIIYLKICNSEVKQFKTIILILISAFLYFIALLTKETAVILPLILFSYEVFLLRKNLWAKHLINCFIRALPFVLVTVIYFVVRFKVIGLISPKVSQNFADSTNATQIIIFSLPNIIINYLKILIFPFNLTPFYPIDYIYSPNLLNFYIPLGVLLVLGTVFLIIAWHNKIIRLALIWLVIPLFPALNIYAIPRENLVQDRYLYFSLIGAGLLLSQLILFFNQWLTSTNDEQKVGLKLHILPLVIKIAIVFILVITTIKQNYIWSDEWNFWSFIKERFSGSCSANLELGRLSTNNNLYEQAISYYEEAKKNCPKSLQIHKQLGTLYGRKGDLVKAEAEFKQMIEISKVPSVTAFGYYNLGLVYNYKGDKEQAIIYLQKAIELDPNSEIAVLAKNKLNSIAGK